MNSTGNFIGLRADKALTKKIDRHVGVGMPGDKDYFANRSAFVRRAILYFLENLPDRQDTVSGVDPT